jgi:hypothetical protein
VNPIVEAFLDLDTETYSYVVYDRAGGHAFRDLRAKLLAVGSTEFLALVEQTERLADDLVDRLEVAGLEAHGLRNRCAQGLAAQGHRRSPPCAPPDLAGN